MDRKVRLRSLYLVCQWLSQPWYVIELSIIVAQLIDDDHLKNRFNRVKNINYWSYTCYGINMLVFSPSSSVVSAHQ